MSNSRFTIEVAEDNTELILNALKMQGTKALKEIGMKAETYAKRNCPVDTGDLRKSITHQVDQNAVEVTIGSNKEYAPYVELGTGKNFELPPGWENFSAKKGTHGRSGGIKPFHFLRDAIQEHIDEYKEIYKKALEE